MPLTVVTAPFKNTVSMERVWYKIKWNQLLMPGYITIHNCYDILSMANIIKTLKYISGKQALKLKN